MITFGSKCCHGHIEYRCLEVFCVVCGRPCETEKYLLYNDPSREQNNIDRVLNDIDTLNFQAEPIK